MRKASILITILFSAILLSIYSCATPPKTYEINKKKVINKNFDQVWTRAIEFFAEQNLPIATIEKASGLIASKDISLSKELAKQWCDCGGEGLGTHHDWVINFNVFIKPIDSSSVSISVNTIFSCISSLGSATKNKSCSSNGNFENELYDFILK